MLRDIITPVSLPSSSFSLGYTNRSLISQLSLLQPGELPPNPTPFYMIYVNHSFSKQISEKKKERKHLLNSITLTRDTHLMQQFIYYYKQLYMFRASICPSSGVLGCIRIILLHMVSSTRCCGWGSEEPQPQHLVLNTICSSIIRIQPNTPEDGHIDARIM